MKASSLFSSIRQEALQAQGPLLFFAAVVAAALMSFYVNLLHESVQRGQQAREEQRTVVGSAAKPVRLADASFTRNTLGAR